MFLYLAASTIRKDRLMRLSLATIAVLALTATAAEKAPTLKKGEKIVFFGDSITEGGVGPKGYVTVVKNALTEKHKDLGIEIVGAGISGNKVPDLQRRLEKDVLAKKPTIVVIQIGCNDARGSTPEKFKAGLEELNDKLRKAEIRVVQHGCSGAKLLPATKPGRSALPSRPATWGARVRNSSSTPSSARKCPRSRGPPSTRIRSTPPKPATAFRIARAWSEPASASAETRTPGGSG